MLKGSTERSLVGPDPKNGKDHEMLWCPTDIAMQLDVGKHTVIEQPCQRLPQQIAMSKLWGFLFCIH